MVRYESSIRMTGPQNKKTGRTRHGYSMCISVMHIMIGKNAVRLCAAALVIFLFLLPAQAGERLVPMTLSTAKSVHVHREILPPTTLNFAGLFSPEARRRQTRRYPYGYTPLSAADAKRYTKIFDLQALGRMEEAQNVLHTVQDDRLRGHVLYQRYTHPAWQADFAALQGWMAHYADYPHAGKIYRLALARKNAPSALQKPQSGAVLPRINEPTVYHPKRDRSPSAQRARIQAEKAAGFLYRGDFSRAFKIAASARAPEAHWIAGLALWQQGKFAEASVYFEKTGASPYASGWLSSAGFYWAARGYARTGEQDKRRAALRHAARHARTFYGLMAVQALGGHFGFDWEKPAYGQEHESLILAQKAGQRAFSLIAAGQYAPAESELMRLDYTANKGLKRAVLAYAAHVGLPGLAMRLGSMVRRGNGAYYDSALYPVSPWSPEGGYRLDPALIHAVIRQESRFDLQAESYSGAVGLMQIMPKTAQYIAGIKGYNKNVLDLGLPATNLKTGQDYLHYLLRHRAVRGDLPFLLMAYNAGPGNLMKWRKSLKTKDPLLFIEMIPVRETRDYVERVLSNYWIYRLRAGLDVPGLAALAKGESPPLRPCDAKRLSV